MKKVLVIGSIPVPVIENLQVKKVDHKDGLVNFLSDNWDVVICVAELEDYKEEEGWFALLTDIQKSAEPGQKIFRAGFLVGGKIPLLRLPFTVEEFKKCCE